MRVIYYNIGINIKKGGIIMATPITAVHPVFAKGVHYVTSSFGNRTYYNGAEKVSDFHNGIDLVAKYIAADHVCAFADGTVTETLNNVTGKVPSQGNYVKLSHEGGAVSVYYHLKAGSVAVKKGERIKAGTVVGYMGSSGNSTGPHLHFGLMIGGSWVDPEPYLTGKKELLNDSSYVPGRVAVTDGERVTDSLVLYIKRSSTGTNKWGTEVELDARGIVLSPPVYGVGNMAVPKGGRVLSGHGRAGKWILENIAAGDLVKIINNKVNVTKGIHRSVLVNSQRVTNSLALYDQGRNAPTNMYGFEAAVDKNGTVLNTPVYGIGKMAIPEGGFVLSGHGKEGKWLYGNIKKGSKVTFNRTERYIRVM